jgi:cytochrome b561
MARQKAPRYDHVSMAVHWLMAVLIIGLLIGGHFLEDMPAAVKADRAVLHAGMGLMALALIVFRIGWRIAHPVAPSPDITKWERRLSKTVKGLLYFFLLLQPAVGIGLALTAGYDVEPFGLFNLSLLGLPDPIAYYVLMRVHGFGFLAIAVLTLIHVAAALRHHFLKKNDVLRRMLPERRSHVEEAHAG